MAATVQQEGMFLQRRQISFEERYRVVQRISRAIVIHRDIDRLFQIIVTELRSVIDSLVIGVMQYDATTASPEWSELDIEGQSRSLSLSLDGWETMTCRLAHELQQPMILEAESISLTTPALSKSFSQSGMLSACVLPLTTVRRRIGAILFANQHSNYFSQDIMSFLSIVAEQIALAIDNVFHSATSEITQGRFEHEAAKVKILLELNNAILGELEPTELIRAISPYLRACVQLDALALMLPDWKNNDLRLHTDFPDFEQPWSPERIANQVFRSGEPWIGAPQQLKGPLEPIANDLKSICVLPIVKENRVLGVLGFGSNCEAAFSEEAIEFLTHITGRVAIAVDHGLAHGRNSSPGNTNIRKQLAAEEDVRRNEHFEELIGNSSAIRKVLQLAGTVAPADTTVLICGETGTGKELVARAIHNLSSRKGGAFVRINCATLPAGLLESELFGHEKGAFTGALVQRIGRFELANHGTIFLDEIGELPLELQPKLLRVLQEKEFERLGGSRTLRTDARLIAATNCDLSAMVEQRKFRSDLLYRLNVFPIQIPPLRERQEDIPPLVIHFVQEFSRDLRKHVDSISDATMDALRRYTWPGNVRELQNLIERAVILSDGPILIISTSELRSNSPESSLNSEWSLEEVERQHILSVLEQTKWVFAGSKGAAARLGMKRSTLQFRLKKLGISRPSKR
jgi:formate hydrogenlyase transcriptional activator